MKIAVVGAGLFGVSTAVELAKTSDVTIFEKESDILRCASGINQYRLHRGYHYPRSSETAKAVQESLPSFLEVYGDAVLRNNTHYYCIAAEESATSAQEFLAFCEQHDLSYEIEDCNLVKKNSIDLCVKVDEHLIDPVRIYEICWRNLRKSGAEIRLNTCVREADLDDFDAIVVCAYAATNQVLSASQRQENYQFEICEKIVLRMPREYIGKSVVILDGPFMCIDPLGQNGEFVMGHVVHAIRETNVGKQAQVGRTLAPYLHREPMYLPSVSRYREFVKDAERFFRGIEKAEYVGSRFVIRTVFPNMDDTDGRPSVISEHDGRVYTVFSGKWVDCVRSAQLVAEMIRSGERQDGSAEMNFDVQEFPAAEIGSAAS